jgi:hypothetical protein
MIVPENHALLPKAYGLRGVPSAKWRWRAESSQLSGFLS